MKFGPVSVTEAMGAILAHSTMAGGRKFRKGTVIGEAEIAAFTGAGIETVIAAVPEAGDIGEDEAAKRLAQAFACDSIEARTPATGRVNLHAATPGILVVDSKAISGVNSVDPSVTIATLPPFASVVRGQMVATVKIIPFAVGKAILDRAIGAAAAVDALAVEPFTAHRVGLVQTTLPSVKDKVYDKTRAVTEARLARSGSTITRENRVAHNTDAIADAITDLAPEAEAVLIFGASAVADGDDLIPAAIRQAGGTVTRFGMPVDPGNLLVLGSLNGKPVIGAPGCARSPKENGFDWVLDRLFAGIEVTGKDIAAMGVGGLLKEMASRPQLREEKSPAGSGGVHAVILAAGQSKRMGDANKLLATFDGQPLIGKIASAVGQSRVSGVTVVVGHQSDRVRAAAGSAAANFVDNPDFAEGLSTSLKAGLAALPANAAGALVVLGDMPVVEAGTLDRLIAAFEEAGGDAVVRATDRGKPGNPVILPRVLFGQVGLLSGDTGARHLIEAAGITVTDVETGPGAAIDVDTPEALRQAGGKLS